MLHLVAIALLPLYLAQVAIAGSLAVTALTASAVVHEPLERRHWARSAPSRSASACSSAVAGHVGTDEHHPHLTTVST